METNREPGNSSKGEPTALREITYQVGWKKGRIRWTDSTSLQAAPASAASEESKLWRLLVRFVWKQAPVLTPSMVFPFLIMLSLISFVLTVALVYQLTQ